VEGKVLIGDIFTVYFGVWILIQIISFNA
jgi:hypothetical protein